MYGNINKCVQRLLDDCRAHRGCLGSILLALVLGTLPNFLAISFPQPTWLGFNLFLFGLGLPLALMVIGLPARPVLWAWLMAVAFVPATCGVLLSTHSFPSTFLFLALLETNVGELSVYQGHAWIAGVTTLALGALYCWVVHRGVPKGFRLGVAIRLTLAALLLLPVLVDLGFHGRVSAIARIEQRLMTTFPTGTIFAAVEAWQFRQKMTGRSEMAERLQVDLSPEAAELERQVHLLVIGESARRGSFGLYGYGRETTPMLDRTPGLLVFEDVTATAPITLAAVPQMLTPTRTGEIREATTLPSVLSAYRAAGFRVYWLSAQRKHGTYDTLTSAFSEDAHEAVFLGGKLDVAGRGTYAGATDMELLPKVRSVLKRGEEKVLILLHTIGSHGPYGSRYSKELNHFEVDPNEANRSLAKVVIQSSTDPADIQRVTDAYDNSIFATDCLLANLVHLVRQEACASWLCYVSDHGENGGDAVMGRFMHGVLTPDVVEVPMLIWLSDGYRSAFPGKSASLEAHLETPFSASCLFHSLTDMGGLTTSFSKPSQSIASKDFNPGPRMLSDVSGKVVNYDEDILPLYRAGSRAGWRPMKPKSLKTTAAIINAGAQE